MLSRANFLIAVAIARAALMMPEPVLGLANVDRRRLPRTRLAAARRRGGGAGQPDSRCPVSGAVFYQHNGVELVVQVQSQFRDLWSLRDGWSDTHITFSGPELASLRDGLNQLDLAS